MNRNLVLKVVEVTRRAVAVATAVVAEEAVVVATAAAAEEVVAVATVVVVEEAAAVAMAAVAEEAAAVAMVAVAEEAAAVAAMVVVAEEVVVTAAAVTIKIIDSNQSNAYNPLQIGEDFLFKPHPHSLSFREGGRAIFSYQHLFLTNHLQLIIDFIFIIFIK
jgi:hypothetical protein